MLLLFWLLPCLSYLALIWWLARAVPAPQYPVLRRLHWGTTGLCTLAVVAPALTLGDWTFRFPGLFCGLLLTSGLLAGIRGRRRLGRLPALATTQAVLIGLASPLLLGYTLGYDLDDASSDIVYADSRYAVTVTEHVTWMEEHLRYPEVQLYGTRLLLFEEYLGHIAFNVPLQYDTPQMRAWWQGVSKLTFAADSNRGTVWREGVVAAHFTVNPPYRRSTSPAGPGPAAPAEALPPEDNKVYTYVENMPGIAGIEGIAGTEAAIERRLVLPPQAQHGRLRVHFVVTKQGQVQQAQVVEGVSPDTDSAVLTTVRQLPRFAPGTQNGQPLNVSLTVTVAAGKEYRR